MLELDLQVWRITLHLLAATVWVGGQIALLALVPVLRSVSDDAVRAAAQRFNQVAWPAFAVLVLTGVWNLLEVSVGDASTEYHVTLGLKLLLVAASGVAAFVHSNAGGRRLALALGGAVSFLGGLASVVLGVALSMGA